jgi:hypothetical protein
VDVVAWLKNLGLGQYEALFRDNAIDREVLPRLTAEDLKDLGAALVGTGASFSTRSLGSTRRRRSWPP